MSLIHPHRNGFNSGINNYSDTLEKTGMDFDILVLNENDKWSIEDNNKEIAVVVVEGKGTIEFQGKEFSFDRSDWISSDPTVVHMSAGEKVELLKECGVIISKNPSVMGETVKSALNSKI